MVWVELGPFLNLGAHVREGYSSHFVCRSVADLKDSEFVATS